MNFLYNYRKIYLTDLRKQKHFLYLFLYNFFHVKNTNVKKNIYL